MKDSEIKITKQLKTMENITKTMFLKTRQCIKAAYLYHNHPELKVDNPLLESIYRKSKEIDIVARELFPEGYDVGAQQYKTFDDFVEYTKFLISMETQVIYQPCIQGTSGRCKSNILVIAPKTWKLYIVKGSTKIDDDHIFDAGYQVKIIKEAYPNIKLEVHLIYLNKEYFRDERLDVEELFITEDVTHKAKLIQPLIERFLKITKKVLEMNGVPKVDIGIHCNKPYECEFKNHCWKHIPDNSIFDISRLWEVRKFQLYEKGIIRLEDVPQEVKLNDKQRLQIECTVHKMHVEDAGAIGEFLKEIEFPLYFMDFETIMPPIPLYKNTSPYSQIPVQYSVHCLESHSSDLIHKEFLADMRKDPRIPFIKNLTEVVKDRGTIFVYNKKFEESRLREISEAFPEYEETIKKIIDRIKDLMIPFEERYLYHPNQKGSVSLKVVLPSWVPELSYRDLAIGNGASVSDQYLKLFNPQITKKEKQKIKRDLLEYCKMDTYALVRLLNVLDAIVLDNGKDIKIAA